MVGDILRVAQLEAAGAQPRDEMHQRYLRGVGDAVKHALAKVGAAERDAVKTADQMIAVIDLNGVAMADVEERAIDLADTRIDPGLVAFRRGLGAAVDHRIEVAVDINGQRRRAHGAGEARRHMEPVERNDAALLRLDPV